MNFKDIYLFTEAHYSTHEAFIDYPSGKKLTYVKFNDLARRVCASYSKEAEVQKGDRIAFTGLQGTCDLLTAALGSWKMGAIPVAVHARVSNEEKAWMINKTEAKVFVYPEEMKNDVVEIRELGIPSVKQFVSLGEAGNFAGENSIEDIYDQYKGAEEPDVKIDDDDDLLICFTSGSTGRPAGIVHKHGGAAFSCIKLNYVCQFNYGTREVDSHAPTTIGFNYMTALLMMCGGSHILMKFDPQQVLKCLSDENITHFCAVFTMVDSVLAELEANADKYDGNSVTHLLWGAMATPLTEKKLSFVNDIFPNAKLASWMASTECAGGFYFTSDYPNLKIKQYGSPGKASPYGMVELRNPEDGSIISKPSELGEVFVRDDGTKTVRVWQDPDDTKERFPGGWWRSRDLAYFDEDGFFYMSGRVDNMFKSGGLKVYPEQVELYLTRHPAVISAVVVPMPDPKWKHVGLAFIRTEESSLQVEGIEKWWKEEGLPGFMRPRQWAIWGRDPFPMIGPEKVDRQQMKNNALKEQK